MMNCRKVQSLVTEYLDGAMSGLTRFRFDLHLRLCEDCRNHVEKMKTLIRSLGAIPQETPVPKDVIDHFRRLAREGDGGSAS